VSGRTGGEGRKVSVVADVYVDRTSDIRMRNASMWSSRSGLRRWMRFGRRRVGRGVIRRVRGQRGTTVHTGGVDEDYVLKLSGRTCETGWL